MTATAARPTKPELREFAPAPANPWSDYDSGRRLAEPIARSEGFAGHANAYTLFEEMEDKDPHLFSALQTRKLGVLSRRSKLVPAGDDERDRQIAAWVERTLGTIPGWQAALLHMLDALGKGMSVLEILWGFDAEGRIVPQALRPRAPERFIHDPAGAWRLNTSYSTYTTGPAGPRGGNAGISPALALPQRKFVITLFGANDDRPYGKGLCEKVFWLWWFKKHNLKFWLVFNEKFGSPCVVARHRAGLSEPERDRLSEVIDAIQHDAGITLPEGIDIELLEASRGGGAESYRELAQWCNDEISRAILGQTLTSGEGQRSGSLALARVHDGVRRDYMRADAWLLMDAVNAQLVRWLVDFNWGEDVPAPRWTIDLAEQLDLEAEAKVDRQLLQMGVALPEKYFYEKYNRPAPTTGTNKLQYDDANLYQYHLQFGILTINEVKNKLGLPAVPWGDHPTSPAAASANQTTGPKDATGEAAGEGNEINLDNEQRRLQRTEK